MVARCNVVGLAVLDVAAGRGRKRSDDEVARGLIVAMAQRTPDRREDGSATWSLSLLVRALRQGGVAAGQCHDGPAGAARGRE